MWLNRLDRGELEFAELLFHVRTRPFDPLVAFQHRELPFDLGEFRGSLGGIRQVANVAGTQHLLGFEQELIHPHAGRVGDAADDLHDLLRLLDRILPERVRRDLQMLGGNFVHTAQVRVGLDDSHCLVLASIAG